MQFQIDNMTCGGCVRSLTKAIARLDHDAVVEADLASKMVTVTSLKPVSEIVSALAEAGFPPAAV
jgi:copper chaperone